MNPNSTVPCGTDGCDLTARWAAGPMIFDGQAVGSTFYECPDHHFTKVETD